MSGPHRFGNYFLHQRLGVGGMGEVFLATRKDASRGTPPLVLKILLPEFGSDSAFVAMLHDECHIGMQLAHPNIVGVYDVGVVGDSHYIALEHVHGVSVRKLQRAFHASGEGFPAVLAGEITVEALHALHHAHRANGRSGKPLNLVHRDLSPENLMVSFDGDTKVLDFGIAKAEGRLSRTRTGVVKGKATYMAPEQAKGDPVDARSDVYAMGLILLELLVGQRRFPAKLPPQEALRRAKTWTATPPSRAHIEDEPFDEIVMKALEVSPEKRWPTAEAFATALFRVLRDLRRASAPESLPGALLRLFPDMAEPFLQEAPRDGRAGSGSVAHEQSAARAREQEEEPIPLTEDDEVTRVSEATQKVPIQPKRR